MWFRKSLASDAEIVQLLRQMHLGIAKLEGEVEKLRAGHQSLRGFVYSRTRKHEETSSEGTLPDESSAPAAPTTGGKLPAHLSREELRRALTQTGRFVPGKAPRHD